MPYTFNPLSGNFDYFESGSSGLPASLTADGSGNLTFTARWIQSTNGAASAPPHALTGTFFTGGTSTTTKPQFLIEPAGATSNNWNTAGTGIGVNAPSGFAGNLLDLQRNGTRLAWVDAQGQNNVNRTSLNLFGSSNTFINFSTTGVTAAFSVDSGGGGLYIDTNTQHPIYFRPGVSTLFSLGQDGVMEFRDNKHIRFGSTTGTKFGVSTTQKFAFWNATPVVQPAAVADATDAASVITQLNAVLARLRTLGLIAT